MPIDRSASRRASACGGNEARETARSALLTGGRYGVVSANVEGKSPKGEIPELVSASLRKWCPAKLPKMLKPVIGAQATVASTRRGARGGRSERLPKECTKYPGYPFRGLAPSVGAGRMAQGINNLRTMRRRESDRLVIAVKRPTPAEPRSRADIMFSIRQGGAA
jgi:hypothetical protein